MNNQTIGGKQNQNKHQRNFSKDRLFYETQKEKMLGELKNGDKLKQTFQLAEDQMRNEGKLRFGKKTETELKMKDIFSRYSDIKSDLDQDRRVLKLCRQKNWNKKKLLLKQQAQEVKHFDPEYFHQYLEPYDLNPQNFDNVGNLWVKYMPPAGKKYQRHLYIFSILEPEMHQKLLEQEKNKLK